MSEPKTKRNRRSVNKFLSAVENETRRQDAKKVCALMKEATGCKPEMWGDSIVGFDAYSYEYASGRKGDWPVVGFSPRKTNLALYIMSGFSRCQELLAKLGKHKTGKSCLYITRLDEVDIKVLKEIVRDSVAHVRSRSK